MKNKVLQIILSVFGLGLMLSTVTATEIQQLTIKNHQFHPAEITIPANTRVKLEISNQDATPEEFESHSLHREKIIPGGSTRTIYIGPLEAGTYEFYGEFNPKTAQGRIIVK